MDILKKIDEAVAMIRSRSSIKPEIGLILGSGLGAIADQVTDAVTISYADIPYFHRPTVEGHAGKMILGKMNGIAVVILQGRFHLYEGHSIQDVAFPTRVVCRLGIHSLVLTNASGGINTRFRPGDLMLIEDHINLMGVNPLSGPNVAELGPRFPDFSQAYHKGCLNAVKRTADELGMTYHTGTYIGLAGPCYETPAEVRMLRGLGADAVGMSTVPETIAANHMGVRVAGVCCITNAAAGLSAHPLSHAEVMETSRGATEKMNRLLFSAIPAIAGVSKNT